MTISVVWKWVSTVHWKGTAESTMLVHARNPSTGGGRRAACSTRLSCYIVSLRLDWDTLNPSNPLVLNTLQNKVKWIMELRKMYFSEKGKQTQNLLFDFEIMIVQVKWNQLLESRTIMQSLECMIYLGVFYLKNTQSSNKDMNIYCLKVFVRKG